MIGSRLIFIQVLIVAGGFSKNTEKFDSTEKLVMLPGNQWTHASSLPRRSAHMASISLHNKIYLLGNRNMTLEPNVKSFDDFQLVK